MLRSTPEVAEVKFSLPVEGSIETLSFNVYSEKDLHPVLKPVISKGFLENLFVC